MKVFVVNLKRRPDRLQQFQQRCPLTEMEVVYGFDGKVPHEQPEEEQEIYNKFTTLPGERGCFISHLRIWKQIVSQNISRALIFEDDAQFSSNFMEMYTAVENETLDLLYLGGRFRENFMMPSHSITNISEIIGTYNYISWDPALHDRTTHSYIISFHMANLLITLFENSNFSNLQLDHFIIQSLKMNKIPIYTTLPLVCWSPAVGDSDIR